MAEKTWEEIVAESQQANLPKLEPAKPAKRKKKEKK